MRLSELSIGKCGRLDGKRFIVIDRAPEDRSSGSTEVEFEGGQCKTFVWDLENPDVTPLGKGNRVVSIEWPHD
jgi:hypothetical protein